MPTRSGVFLTAGWRHLATLNFEVEPALLAPLVLSGTELDSWRGAGLTSPRTPPGGSPGPGPPRPSWPETIAEDIRLHAPGTREVVSGANVYRQVMQRIWWAYPLYLLTRVPGCRSLFDLAYRRFADNRHAFSKSCGLHGRRPEGEGTSSER